MECPLIREETALVTAVDDSRRQLDKLSSLSRTHKTNARRKKEAIIAMAREQAETETKQLVELDHK